MKLKNAVITAMLMALTVLLTISFHITIPQTGGYVHLGDTIIYITIFLLGKRSGTLVGALGGTIADMLTSPMYTPVTFVVKGISSYISGILYEKFGGKLIGSAISFLIGGMVMVLGYYFAEAIMFGSFVTPIASIPFNIAQAVSSAVIACIFIPIFKHKIL